MTIVLHQFAPAFGVPNPSPFCMKLECFLRMTGLDFEIATIASPRNGPKGKAPYVEVDGEIIGDSALIIERLKKRFDVDPDAGLSPSEQAMAHAIGIMCEDHLYFCARHGRWIDPTGASLTQETFFAKLPAWSRGLLFALVRRNVRRSQFGQGMGRHEGEEIYALGASDVDALSAFLGDKPFMMGEEPMTVDCITHAFIANLVRVPFQDPICNRARAHANLVAYDQRMMKRFFPNFEAGSDSRPEREEEAA